MIVAAGDQYLTRKIEKSPGLLRGGSGGKSGKGALSAVTFFLLRETGLQATAL